MWPLRYGFSKWDVPAGVKGDWPGKAKEGCWWWRAIWCNLVNWNREKEENGWHSASCRQYPRGRYMTGTSHMGKGLYTMGNQEVIDLALGYKQNKTHFYLLFQLGPNLSSYPPTPPCSPSAISGNSIPQDILLQWGIHFLNHRFILSPKSNGLVHTTLQQIPVVCFYITKIHLLGVLKMIDNLEFWFPLKCICLKPNLFFLLLLRTFFENYQNVLC